LRRAARPPPGLRPPPRRTRRGGGVGEGLAAHRLPAPPPAGALRALRGPLPRAPAARARGHAPVLLHLQARAALGAALTRLPPCVGRAARTAETVCHTRDRSWPRNPRIGAGTPL